MSVTRVACDRAWGLGLGVWGLTVPRLSACRGASALERVDVHIDMILAYIDADGHNVVGHGSVRFRLEASSMCGRFERLFGIARPTPRRLWLSMG